MPLSVTIPVKNEKESQEINQAIKATNKSDPKQADVDALNKILDDRPDVWKSVGEIAVNTQISIIDYHFSNSPIVKESIKRQLKAMRDNLGWNEASELEKLLIRQVCLCWLNVHITEVRRHDTIRGQHSMREGLYWEKALLAAQKRYLKAVETLGRMQKIVTQTKEIQARADDAKASQALKAAKLLNNLSSGIEARRVAEKAGV